MMHDPMNVKLLSFLQHVLHSVLFSVSVTFAKSFEGFLIKIIYVAVLFVHVLTA